MNYPFLGQQEETATVADRTCCSELLITTVKLKVTQAVRDIARNAMPRVVYLCSRASDVVCIVQNDHSPMVPSFN